MTIRRAAAALVIGAALAVLGCEGGKPDEPPPPASNNWDSMVWDQSNWG